MASGPMNAAIRQIQRLFQSGSASGLSEAQLLARFVEKRDEAAFEALVSRFGPMVLGVCRQILDDPHAAEDAFQATFLVLVRRARSIRDRDLLGNWLYGVTLKVARRARADLARRRAKEKEGAEVRSESLGDRPAFDDPDLGPILHEELARLPEKYRAPVVLCYLDGRTHEEAARLLNWPVGSVKGRLSRARDMLRDRLGRRGVTASAVLVAATLTKTAQASVPLVLLNQTVKAAMALAAGGAIAAGLSSATAIALSEGVVTSMIVSKAKVLAMTAALFGTLMTGVGVMATQEFAPAQDDEKAAKAETPKAAPETPKTETKATTTTTTTVGPPISPAGGGQDVAPASRFLDQALKAEGEVGKLPSAKELAERRVAAAQQAVDAMGAFYQNGTVTLDRVLAAVKSLMEAKVATATSEAARIKAVEDYVRALRVIHKTEEGRLRVGIGGLFNVAEVASALADAEAHLEKVRGGSAKVPATIVDQPGAVVVEDEDDIARDKAILKKLNQPIALPFPNETPLEDVVKYIQTATSGPDMPRGIPIYVDPVGLQEAEKTMSSPVSFNMEEIKLKTTLRLMLKPLQLGYYIREGLLVITNLGPDFSDITEPGWRDREAEKARRVKQLSGMMGGGGMMGGAYGPSSLGGGIGPQSGKTDGAKPESKKGGEGDANPKKGGGFE